MPAHPAFAPTDRLRRTLVVWLAFALPWQTGALAVERVEAPAHFHIAAAAAQGHEHEHEPLAPPHDHAAIDRHAHDHADEGVVYADDGGDVQRLLIDQQAALREPPADARRARPLAPAVAPPAAYRSRAAPPPRRPPRG